MNDASYYRYAPLREAIAAKEGVDPEQVVAADGTSMANMLAMAALIAPGDEVPTEAALERVGDLGAFVLVDEVYRDAAFDAAPRSCVHLGERFVATSSLTKVYG